MNDLIEFQKKIRVLERGRVARILSTLMASQAGLPMLNFKDITGSKRKEYFTAINNGLSRDYRLMERLFEMIIERSIKANSVEI